MEKINDILMCPCCHVSIDESMECKECGNKYSYSNGVYNLVSEKLSGNQEILWGITDEIMENTDEYQKYLRRIEEQIRDYDDHKNKETIDAQVLQGQYMEKLIEGFSGIVCDLSTGRGNMLRRMMNSTNKDFTVVCTDIDSHILMCTRRNLNTNDKRVHYVASDGRYMSLMDDSVDYITSLAAFGNIPENKKVAGELYRILKPHGKIVIQGNYIEKDSKSFELARSKGLEEGLVEEYLLDNLKKAGFKNVTSTVVAEARWAENPYDLLPVAGDSQRYCIIEAEK